jgi:hypothetical protein
MFKYPDDIRLIKIEDKLDETLQFWFKNFRNNINHTWHDFKQGLPNCLKPSSTLVDKLNDDNPHAGAANYLHEQTEKPSLLDVC